MLTQAQAFLELAPLTAAQAATIILDAMRVGEWRILVGDDAHTVDALVRSRPREAYDPEFMDDLRATGSFGALRSVVATDEDELPD